jgi:hypothetical protein
MSKTTWFRLGAGALIALALGGCYYPYGHRGYYGGGYHRPAYSYWR